jgi:hypothetical protein
MSFKEGADEAKDPVADHMPTGILEVSNVLDALRSRFATAAYPVGLSPSALLFALLCRDPVTLGGPLLGRGVEGTGPGTAVVLMTGAEWPLAAEGIGGSLMTLEQKADRNG